MSYTTSLQRDFSLAEKGGMRSLDWQVTLDKFGLQEDALYLIGEGEGH